MIFRVADNTWLETIVRYLVAPREAGHVKTRLIKKLLAALNAAPDKVMFPAGANRQKRRQVSAREPSRAARRNLQIRFNL